MFHNFSSVEWGFNCGLRAELDIRCVGPNIRIPDGIVLTSHKAENKRFTVFFPQVIYESVALYLCRLHIVMLDTL